jgi:hypothetical protein
VVTVRYTTSKAATVELRLMRDQRRVSQVRVEAVQGRNTIRLRVPQRAGNYRLALTAKASDGQRATADARLTVKRPQPAR